MSQQQKFYLQFDLKSLLDAEIKNSLQRGSILGMLLGLISSLILALCMGLGLTKSQEVPLIWALFCTLSCYLSWRIAKGRLGEHPFVKYVVSIFFVSLPSLLFLISHYLLPSGAATYINGPPLLIYFFILAWTGFFFDERLSNYVGLLAGLEYFGCYLLAAEPLKDLKASEAIMLQDLTDPSMFVLKALMIWFTGKVVGIISANEMSFLKRVLQIKEETIKIDGLLGEFLSPAVKQKILERPNYAQVESVELVVLFADIRNFTAFCEEKEPDEVIAQLNEYFESMVKTIQYHGGVVDKFIGDAIMANFGGLIELKNPSQSALEAAMGMRFSLEQLNREWQRQGIPTLDNGIGLHYGKVLQGAMGAMSRREFTLLGDTVNLASRLEGLTKRLDSPILLSCEVQKRLDSVHNLIDYGLQGIRGRREKVYLYGVGSKSKSPSQALGAPLWDEATT